MNAFFPYMEKEDVLCLNEMAMEDKKGWEVKIF